MYLHSSLRIPFFLIFLFLLVQTPEAAPKPDYRLFENISLGTEASAISCFLQDTGGLIWIGSNKGLFSYDGYSTQPHFVFGRRSNTRIYCGEVADSTYLYLGADNGWLIYNYRTDAYEEPATDSPADIRALKMYDGILWLGTLNGLFTYCPDTRRFAAIGQGLPHQTVYSLLRTADNQLYVGTYNGCCRYLPATGGFEPVELPVRQNKSNLFVNSLLEDMARKCIWIGTEGYLFKYTPADGRVQRIDAFHDNSVKSLALDGYGRLLVGTDNGLYVYREDAPLLHIVHDSRNPQSLSNNIVWTIFTDGGHNVWLGTDYGISMSRSDNVLRHIPISQITGTGEGNLFYSMLRDARGNFWFGGTNGLIRFTLPADGGPNAPGAQGKPGVTWYKMGDSRFPLSHNRVRQLYEDRDGQLWTATDGSISRYDTDSHRFITYNIVDSTRCYNANWAYSLFEDEKRRLWIATCLGGVFVVDKQKLMQSAGKPYVAEKTYSIHNGLSGMFVNQMTPDRAGNVWILLYNSSNSIEKINVRTGRVTHIAAGQLTGERAPNYILCAEDGYIWIGFPGGVMRVTPSDNTVRILPFDAFGHYEVLSMVEVDGRIWIATTEGLWVADQRTLELRRLRATDHRFTAMFFDKGSRELYLGTADGFLISSPDALLAEHPDRPLLLTALYVNNRLYQSDTGQAGQSIRYIRHIELASTQNNLAFELSDLPYSQEEKSRLIYRLEGIDRDWNLLHPNINRITYSNLGYGEYRLTVSRLDTYGKPEVCAYTLDISILPPWYYTWWAKTTYVLLSLALMAWVLNFFRVKNRLKAERMEKERIMEQSRAKMEFFTNLSHDLKMPLSMIVAPVSRMLPKMREGAEKRELEHVHRNAMKLNALIHQGLDFDRIDNGKNALLIMSQIELVSFARELFELYAEEKAKEKRLTFDFRTEQEKIYVQMDAIKLESILNNLLSNAVKYTPEEGKVTLSLGMQREAETVCISVTDTGVGIAGQDRPYIFQRFFQSPRASTEKKGTGIGLYLVKTYTELHGGTVSLVSEEGEGTTVTLNLPVICPESSLPLQPTHRLSSQKVKPHVEVPVILKETEVMSYDEKFLANVIRLIEEHISDSELNVNALCEWTATNNKQMYRKLKQLTGQTPVEYIKSIRMKKAAMLLQQNKFTVAEVMYMVGFSNHSYFSKCFQAEFGVTPKQYKAE